MSNNAPDIETVKKVSGRYLNDITRVERVPEGVSTYVYRVNTGSGTFYIRFLPEEASFAAEVLVHDKLLEKGVNVPRVIGWEHRDEETGLSVMITDEIPGVSVDKEWPPVNEREIFNEAGKQLALIHEVPVEGFGWIDRTFYDELRGEKKTYMEFFNNELPKSLEILTLFDFSDTEINRINELVETAGRMTDTEDAVLIHGDFDSSHIYHDNGRYTGIIDFGEIRGGNWLTDLATCLLLGLNRRQIVYEQVLEGYRTISSLTDDDLYAIELFALYISVMGMGNRESRPRLADFFYTRGRSQFERIKVLYGI